jgi:hypothetical protein
MKHTNFALSPLALSLAPGVSIQHQFGSEEARISIRGSTLPDTQAAPKHNDRH